jgi:hypothetical protein
VAAVTEPQNARPPLQVSLVHEVLEITDQPKTALLDAPERASREQSLFGQSFGDVAFDGGTPPARSTLSRAFVGRPITPQQRATQGIREAAAFDPPRLTAPRFLNETAFLEDTEHRDVVVAGVTPDAVFIR